MAGSGDLGDSGGATAGGGLPPAVDAVWRAQREAARRVTDVWGRLLSADPLGNRHEVTDQLQVLLRSSAEYAGAAVGPVRELIRGQRELAERMATWAELQRDLADQVAQWARIQRELADTVERLLPPFLPPSASRD